MHGAPKADGHVIDLYDLVGRARTGQTRHANTSSYTPADISYTNGGCLAGRRMWLQSPPDKGVRVDHLTVSLDSPRNAPSLSSCPTAPAAA